MLSLKFISGKIGQRVSFTNLRSFERLFRHGPGLEKFIQGKFVTNGINKLKISTKPIAGLNSLSSCFYSTKSLHTAAKEKTKSETKGKIK